MDVNATVAATLAKVLATYQAGLDPAFVNKINGLDPAAVRKDYPSGLVGYDLEPAARVLQPVITPLRNRLPRVAGKGGTAANWRQVTTLDTNKTNQFPGFGTKANVLSYTETDRSATYKSIALGDNVSIEAIQQAKGLEDARAQMAVRLLENVMIVEEQTLIGGRGSAALGTVTAPTVANTTTGGTVAANTYYVTVRACTGIGRSTAAANISAATASPARGKKSIQTATTTSGSTSTINASTPAVVGALFYEWYVGTNNDNTTCTLEAITSINSVNLTAIAGTGGIIPADNSQDSNSFDGLFVQGISSSDYNAFGYTKKFATGTNGTGTVFQISDIDTMLVSLWQTYGAIPDALLTSPNHAKDLTAKARSAGMIRQVVDNGPGLGKLMAGSRVSGYIHPVVDKELEIIADPWWFDGSIMAVSFGLPPGVPLAETRNAYEVKTQLDYYQLEYAVIAPKYEIEVRSLEALATYFLLGTGILWNVANG